MYHSEAGKGTDKWKKIIVIICKKSVISNGDKRMQALKVPLYPYHDVINYTNNLITFFDILRSIYKKNLQIKWFTLHDTK